MKIDDMTIRRVKEAAKIYDVVSDFIKLRKTGVRWTALCPFHEDRRDGNFIVYPRDNCYRCFTCEAKGGPIEFLMNAQHLSFGDSIRYLGKKYSIPVDDVEIDYTPAPPRPAPPPLPTLTLPMSWVENREHTDHDALVAWIRSIPWDEAQRARINPMLHAYHVGHSTITQRDSTHEFTVFWQIDEKGQPRTAHYMKYNPDGHRVKKEQDRYHTDWFHAMLARDERWKKYYDEDKQQARQCLFGMHLLDAYGPSAAVHIVESEKTALLMAIAYGNTPLQVWMATCGEGNLTREKLMPIIRQGRHIILYPDRDGIGKWKTLASMLRYDNVVVDTKPVTEWWKEGDGEKADIADVVVRIISENTKRTIKTDRVAELMKRKPAMKELIERLDLKRI